MLGSTDGWVHCVQHILNNGRCGYMDLDEEADPDGFAAQEKAKKDDPVQDQVGFSPGGKSWT